MKRIKSVLLLFIVLVTFSCSKKTDDGEISSGMSNTGSPNILFIIADDLGKDAIMVFLKAQ
jgi:hypothetical protein